VEIKALQARLEQVLAGVRHPRVGAALALAEEVGEVSDLVLKAECYGQAPTEGALAGELADVVVCVAELASAYGVDLQAACAAKVEDLSARVPAWERDLGPSLERARGRMD
jgi:NTP pyrophosphatase (non-canonical NTP hydrolase)